MTNHLMEWLQAKGNRLDTEMEQRRGVYAIVCTLTSRAYIGATQSSFGTRFKQHINQLEAGKHINRRLQHDYDRLKHIEGAFWLIVLEVTDSPLDLEQEYIKFFRKHGIAYNVDASEQARQRAAERKRKREKKRPSL